MRTNIVKRNTYKWNNQGNLEVKTRCVKTLKRRYLTRKYLRNIDTTSVLASYPEGVGSDDIMK